ncbi:zinc-dependent metalloprotease [Actinomyces bowdenii]|uniref:zinc-dependent metalloprotease n=1 Tax=Actinomyces bowdenii TaxID=131109 RepID=UPI00214CD1B1|nr:zinc-dependent metalloprotease [Actinomyces bowdenii]MCR2051622.1 zinc-dependent metalloprotease [Actinomyces bowdenii]
MTGGTPTRRPGRRGAGGPVPQAPVPSAPETGGLGTGAGSAAASGTAAGLIDWPAVDRLSALVPPGPVVSRSSRAGVVAVLRRSAQESPAWIAEITGLRRAAGLVAAGTDVRVVDRRGLIRASAAGLRALMEAVPAPPAGPGLRRAGAVEVAGALGLVSTRLLGQVLPTDPAAAPPPVAGGAQEGAPTARLLLVAPNVLQMRRRLDLDLLDLPAWVSLHETTHAVQLAAAPWLMDYLTSRMRAVIAAVVGAIHGPGSGGGPSGSRWLRGAHAGAVLAGRSPSLEELVGRRDRRALTELSCALTLLEGHAETVLDAVGPKRLPSVHRLRAVLSRARGDAIGVGPGPGSGSILHRLVSLDAKEAQYADGAAFVRAVVTRVGHEGLNRVWALPRCLPTPAEIARPDLWIERMG